MKGDPFPTVFAWASSYPPNDLFTTAIKMSEVLYGIERLPRGKRRDQLLGEAESVFVEDFAGRILASDESSARMFAVIATQRHAQGRPIDEPDAQIAAIAKVHGATLATRNTEDFEGCGYGWSIPGRPNSRSAPPGRQPSAPRAPLQIPPRRMTGQFGLPSGSFCGAGRIAELRDQELGSTAIQVTGIIRLSNSVSGFGSGNVAP